MHEPVEDRGAHRVVAQVCAPILHNAVGRDDNASMQFVALMDQRLQQRAGGVGDRTRQEQVIQHEQIALEDGSQPGFALGSRAQRVTVKEVVGLKILHLVALQDGLVGDGLRNVRFAGAWFTDDQRVVASGDELQRVQLEAGLARHFGIEGPVEFGEREFLFEAGELVAAFDESGLAAIQFVLRDQCEGFKERLLGALGLQHARFECVAHARQAELSESPFDFR